MQKIRSLITDKLFIIELLKNLFMEHPCVLTGFDRTKNEWFILTKSGERITVRNDTASEALSATERVNSFVVNELLPELQMEVLKEEEKK